MPFSLLDFKLNGKCECVHLTQLMLLRYLVKTQKNEREHKFSF